MNQKDKHGIVAESENPAFELMHKNKSKLGKMKQAAKASRTLAENLEKTSEEKLMIEVPGLSETIRKTKKNTNEAE